MSIKQPIHETYYTEKNKFYRLYITPEKMDHYEKEKGFSFFRQIDKIVFGYFFKISEKDYKEGRQSQREVIHKDTLDKVYGRKYTTVEDILLEDISEEIDDIVND